MLWPHYASLSHLQAPVFKKEFVLKKCVQNSANGLLFAKWEESPWLQMSVSQNYNYWRLT